MEAGRRVRTRTAVFVVVAATANAAAGAGAAISRAEPGGTVLALGTLVGVALTVTLGLVAIVSLRLSPRALPEAAPAVPVVVAVRLPASRRVPVAVREHDEYVESLLADLAS